MFSRTRLLLPSLLFAVVACAAAPLEPTDDPSGTYTLTTINGKPLPGVVSRTSDRTIELVATTITIAADHRFSYDGRMRVTTAAGAVETGTVATGRWTLRGRVVDFAPDQAVNTGVSAMTWDGAKTLTLTDPTGSVPVTMVFTR